MITDARTDSQKTECRSNGDGGIKMQVAVSENGCAYNALQVLVLPLRFRRHNKAVFLRYVSAAAVQLIVQFRIL